jgi:putative transposase
MIGPFSRKAPKGKKEKEPMKDWQSLSHVKWDCKYHVVIVSKYRKRAIYGKLREKIGGIIRDLCRQKGIEIHEGHAMPDHVHILLSIPPKYSVSNTIGFIKGKSAIRIHRNLLKSKKMTGLNFWARGYCVSTVGFDEEAIRKYIKEQDKNNE